MGLFYVMDYDKLNTYSNGAQQMTIGPFYIRLYTARRIWAAVKFMTLTLGWPLPILAIGAYFGI